MKDFIKASAALALIAALSASCQQNVVPEVQSDISEQPAMHNPISFDVPGIQKTKAVSEVSTSTFQKTGAAFNVCAVADSASKYVYFNEKVTLSDGKFKTATSYYYPLSGTLDFYAVYPLGQTLKLTNGVVSTTYTVDGDTDLVVASAYAKGSSTSPVALEFKHALAQIKFEAKGADTAVDYSIRSVKIVSPKSGEYKFAQGADQWVIGDKDSTLYDASAKSVYPVSANTSSMTAFGEAETYIPGTTSFEICWDCLKNGKVVASYKRSANLTLTAGKKTTVQLSLPNDLAAPISFTVTVANWESESKQIDMSEKTE